MNAAPSPRSSAGHEPSSGGAATVDPAERERAIAYIRAKWERSHGHHKNLLATMLRELEQRA